MIEVEWNILKTFVIDKGLSIQYFEYNNHYFLHAYDGPYCLHTKIFKNDGAEQQDFETNFKSGGNRRIQSNDVDAALMIQPKLATSGRSYQSSFIEIETSTTKAISKKSNWSDTGFASVVRLDVNGEVTEVEADTVWTLLNIDCGKTYEIQGGWLYQKIQPTEDCYVWAIAAAHIPEQYGGNKEFVQGVNLALASYGVSAIEFDGDTTTKVEYDPVNYSHLLQIKVKHPAGLKHRLMVEIIWYV